MADTMTLEQAQAKILELQEQNAQLTNERDTLSQNNADLTGELETVKKLNQQYFNKLSQQYIPTEDKNDDDEVEVPSCEDFAKTLHII
jgi:FtsZ-binding cell division protein ZapB